MAVRIRRDVRCNAATRGQLVALEFGSGDTLLGGAALTRSWGDPIYMNQGTVVAGTANNLMGDGGKDVIFQDADNSLLLYEFGTTGKVIDGYNLTWGDGSLVQPRAVKKVIGVGQNIRFWSMVRASSRRSMQQSCKRAAMMSRCSHGAKSLAVSYRRRFFASETVDYVFGRHARTASREMREVASDCRIILEEADVEGRALRRLYDAIDAYARWRRHRWSPIPVDPGH
jgi:hypothetical protein